MSENGIPRAKSLSLCKVGATIWITRSWCGSLPDNRPPRTPDSLHQTRGELGTPDESNRLPPVRLT